MAAASSGASDSKLGKHALLIVMSGLVERNSNQ